MAKSRLTEAEWTALLERYVRGEGAAKLALEAGVSHNTFRRQARLRGYRRMDRPDGTLLPPGPPKPDDWRDPRGKLSEGEWRALLERYLAGEAPEALAVEHEVTVGSIAEQARLRGMRKCDRADAVYRRWREPIPSGARTREFEFRASEGGGHGEDIPTLAASRPPLPTSGEGEAPARPSLVLRAAQRPPEGRWATWLFLGGRGAGKTLAGAEWTAARAQSTGRIALVGATLHDVREVMVEGPSGIRALPRYDRPESAAAGRPSYEPTRRRLLWPNGAVGMAFSAEDPESLRGPQFGAAWADELCVWKAPDETLALLRMGLRLGADPRLVVTTTPKPLAALRRLRAEASCMGTHAPTRDNAENLAPAFLEGLEALYGGTRRAAQELDGVLVESEGALWRAEDLARCRGAAVLPGTGRFDRVVVGVDPPAGSSLGGGSACGIVVAGRLGERAFVLADRSAAGLSPLG